MKTSGIAALKMTDMHLPDLHLPDSLRRILVVMALLLATAAQAQLDLSTFKLTFSDEFDGDQLDTTKWQAPEMPRQGPPDWQEKCASFNATIDRDENLALLDQALARITKLSPSARR